MREDVCIVLNEREPRKFRAAEELESELRARDLTTSRVNIGKQILSVLKRRCPRVIVLDYLIGDYSTGLDIVSTFDDLEEDEKPKFLFLTDEPSVQVAVSAMKMGVLDYLELEHPDSLSKAVEIVSEAAQTVSPPHKSQRGTQLKLIDLIALDPATIQVREKFQSLKELECPIVLLHGPPGSGLSTWAKALAHELDLPYVRELSLLSYTAPVQSLFKTKEERYRLQVGAGLSLLIENIEEDDGQLLGALTDYVSQSNGLESNDRVILICSDSKIVSNWQKQIKLETIALPALEERPLDIPHLIQHFLTRIERSLGRKSKGIEKEQIDLLKELPWPGNCRQLYAVLAECVVRQRNSKSPINELLLSAKDYWESQHSLSEGVQDVSLYKVAVTLAANNYDYRRTAATLGIRLSLLMSFLEETPETQRNTE